MTLSVRAKRLIFCSKQVICRTIEACVDDFGAIARTESELEISGIASRRSGVHVVGAILVDRY